MAPDSDLFQTLYQQHGAQYQKGSTVYQEGQPGSHLYVVLEGRVVVTRTDPKTGRSRILRVAGPGDLLGEDGVLGAEPYATGARVLAPARLLALDRDGVTAAVRDHPEAATALLAAALERLRATLLAAEAPPAEAAKPTPAADGGPLQFNQEWFYTEQLRCPVCEAEFHALRVRSRAVNSVKRDSDFHYVYRSVNPLHYAVTVCPHCFYAAYNDDFATLTRAEAEALRAESDARRLEAVEADLRGERDPDAAIASFRLALQCYEKRKADGRRQAGLLHRIAWIERERGNQEREREYLAQALEVYQRAFETSTDISEDAAVTLCYLMGDLSLRLERYNEAVRWFSHVTRMPQAKKHPEILRLTRDRWAEVRDLAPGR
ncbi:MAG TPA: DUF2225 domain-containing protein [Dehalococcoidia bacterium]